MNLNPQQLEAVSLTEGPLLIIAGAGSGKTRVLTERLINILQLKLARPEEILTVTFTNKAAAEIKSRVLEKLVTEHIYNVPWMGTFHSIAVKILRSDGYQIGIDNRFVIYDANDQVDVIKQAMKELNINSKNFSPRSIQAAISSAKNELISPVEYVKNAQGFFQEQVAQIYQAYQKILVASKALDFDDLLMNTVKLLTESPDSADKYQNLFKYVMVDEYQDTNHAQYMMIKLLAAKYQNLCVVGDDDQSIYAWRGANIKNILEFERDFPKVNVIKLEQNYRSTQVILAASNAIVKNISQRRAKKLWTQNPEGEQLKVYNALDEKDEAYWTVDQIAKLIDEGIPPREIAILYRMNAQSRVLEEALLQGGIAYQIVGNVRFYDRKEVKDILGYLRLIYNHQDRLALLRIINIPSRKIGAKTIALIANNANKANLSELDYLLNQIELLSGGVLKFAQTIKDIEEKADTEAVAQLIKYIIERTQYLEMLNDGKEENIQRMANLEELLNVASKFNEYSPQASLQAFLEEVALLEAQTTAGDDQQVRERITMMTVHNAKGLEYSAVYIVGLEEGIFPHSRSLQTPTEIDEERRLAYVAITRAKEKLSLVYTSSRTLFGGRQGSIPSRFISEIPEELIKLVNLGDINFLNSTDEEYTVPPQFNVKANDRVKHPKFGDGVIISINEDTVIVDFKQFGAKELVTEYAGLAKI